ncbi:hypothetical protein Syun_007007 [Stephania yunnanensis]|uniref:Pectin acetylesterase n=1 Tax=Stephania yunnanensis TaxID=152371 RepID=A0AAP0KXZ4_9MAGN
MHSPVHLLHVVCSPGHFFILVVEESFLILKTGLVASLLEIDHHCTNVDYALELWRLRDPEAHLISLKELMDQSEGTAKWLLDEIAHRETDAERSLMHGEISAAQDKLISSLQIIYLNQPDHREIIRLIMATVGRGGHGDLGQRIRDEILVIQVLDAASREGAIIIDHWFAGCAATYVVCEGLHIHRYFSRTNNLVTSVALSVGAWFFDRVGVSAIDCPYPCDNTCHNLVSK